MRRSRRDEKRKPQHDLEKCHKSIAREPTMTSRYALALIAVLITAPSVASSTTGNRGCTDGPSCPPEQCNDIFTVRRNPFRAVVTFSIPPIGRIVVRPVV